MPTLPKLHSPLEPEHLELLNIFSKSCRHSILAMTTNAQSGHPGGSLSCIDYLSVLYAFIIGQTGEDVVVSNGHISPAVYSTLAEMGYVSKQEAVETFRKIGSVFEGHVTRHVQGVHYGTGPLGIGTSVATGFAYSEKLKKSEQQVYLLLGDGEAQEGQVYEMMNMAAKYQLDNLIAFVDFNEVQLSGSLDDIMPIHVADHFAAAGWNVLEINGHDYQAIWEALGKAQQNKGTPTVIIGHTIMGKGVDFMEKDGAEHKADWHGKAAKPEQAAPALELLTLSDTENQLLDEFRKNLVSWHPKPHPFTKLLTKNDQIDVGTPIEYAAGTITDCRSAYGAALLDLAKNNERVVALCADLRDSVKTDGVAKNFPARHIEVGIAEQHMVSMAGGLSLNGFVPFASTFGAFMTSRAKDQARVNDINQTNVKMVATHCGLSVGEDGPTHQAIDDMSSFAGFFHTMVLEPADANQCDHLIRYAATHYGNFYIRMGRHKFPVILKEDGSIFYDKNYQYSYGQSDIIRSGTDLTIAATGACVHEALMARESLQTSHPDLSLEIVAVSSIKHFDDTLIHSIKKTGKLITVEDHNVHSGLGNQLAALLTREKINLEHWEALGVREYQLSGTAEELYEAGGISAKKIEEACLKIVK